MIAQRRYVLLLIAAMLYSTVNAQFIVRPLKKDISSFRTSGIQEADTIQLPFWDDFSTAENIPDPVLWFAGETVSINSGQSIQPPSINAATFDGVNALGNPYDPTPQAKGMADSLISQCIDLEGLSPVQNDSVFFSFWYQLKGNVEQPDPEDSINLSFLDPDGNWQIMWSALGSNMGTKFDSVLIQVEPSFFHGCFQFKFQSFGSLEGPFDAWHIDYVYLNDSRVADDYGIPDRTITRPPSKILDVFNAVPLDHFKRDSSLVNELSQTQFFNHDNQQVTGFNFQAAVWTEHLGQKVTIDSIRPNGAFDGQVPFPFNRRLLEADNALDIFKVFDFLDTTDLESITLNTTFAISGTGDLPDFDGSINFLVNDTVTLVSELADYYAYDDGEAEFEFGVVGAGTKLAYQYFVSEPSELTSIDIGFTSGDLSEIDLTIWSSIDPGQENILVSKTDQVTDNNGEFVRYSIPSTFVSDTFYIGYIQQVDGFVFLGLDKDNETNQRIFFNGEGIWEQDLINISGSLLMRPVFGDSSLVVGIEEREFERSLRIYPNPARDYFQIEGTFDELTLYDITGRPVAILNDRRRQNARIDTAHLRPGMYIARIRKDNLYSNQKILIKD